MMNSETGRVHLNESILIDFFENQQINRNQFLIIFIMYFITCEIFESSPIKNFTQKKNISKKQDGRKNHFSLSFMRSTEKPTKPKRKEKNCQHLTSKQTKKKQNKKLSIINQFLFYEQPNQQNIRQNAYTVVVVAFVLKKMIKKKILNNHLLLFVVRFSNACVCVVH